MYRANGVNGVAPARGTCVTLVHLSSDVLCAWCMIGKRSCFRALVRQVIASYLFMDYYTETLPEHLSEGCEKGSWKVRNARFRRALCDYLELKWFNCSGDGNCFFEAVCMLLRSVSIQPDLTAAQLRADVVQYLRLCPGSTQDLPERITIEMEDELSEPLVCSTRGRLNGAKLNGFVPSSVAEYLDASACDKVWVRGLHWLRAISYLYEVRVAVIINGQHLVRYIGAGEKTIHLYKFDAETHWDPLLPIAYAPPSLRPSTLSSTLSDSDSGLTSPKHETTVTDLPRLRQRKPVIFQIDSSSDNDDSRMKRGSVVATKRERNRSASGTYNYALCFTVYTLLTFADCAYSVYTTLTIMNTVGRGMARKPHSASGNNTLCFFSVYTAYLCSLCIQCIHYTHYHEHSWARNGQKATFCLR